MDDPSRRDADALADSPQRLIWLDGLRGVAAMQVVLLHYASAFLPAIGLPDAALAHYGWERWVVGTPLFNIWNGYASIYVFFLLSGVALTFSFGRAPFALLRWATTRVVRLGLPMMGAIIFGATLIAVWPDAHVKAASLSGSTGWMARVMNVSPNVYRVLHQIVFEGMIFGYDNATPLPYAITHHINAVGVAGSFDPPLWTLHLEFLGSFLVLGLVLVRATVPTWAWRLICVGLLFVLSTSPLSLFIVGHLLAPVLRAGGWRGRGWFCTGAACVMLGLLLCSGESIGAIVWLRDRVAEFHPRGAAPALSVQNMLGAVLIFLGLCQMPSSWPIFCGSRMRWLGQISFSLYLTHYPVLFTIICIIFIKVLPLFGYGGSIFICLGLGLVVSLIVAIAFERWVDRPAIYVSRFLGAAGTGKRRIVA